MEVPSLFPVLKGEFKKEEDIVGIERNLRQTNTSAVLACEAPAAEVFCAFLRMAGEERRGSRRDSGPGRRFWFSLNVRWRELSQKTPSMHLEDPPGAGGGKKKNGCWTCLALWEVWVPRAVITL